MSAKAEQKERTHETILESASRLLRDRGHLGRARRRRDEGRRAHRRRLLRALRARRRRSSTRRSGARAPRCASGSSRDSTRSRRRTAPRSSSSATSRRRTATTSTHGCPLPAVVGEVGTTAAEHRAALGEQVDAWRRGSRRSCRPRRSGISRRHLALGAGRAHVRRAQPVARAARHRALRRGPEGVPRARPAAPFASGTANRSEDTHE